MSRNAGLSCVASAVAILSPQVHAQTDEVDQRPAAETGQLTEIVVTGSRIARGGYDAPTPVTALNTDELVSKAPNSLSDALNQLPSFTDSVNVDRSQGTQAAQIRTGSYLNLRGLGPERVLVLQNGQRLAPSATGGAVDTSLIPELLVQRVEVVTGGASAVYGSDAVSGVVNFILDDDLQGLKFRTQAGTATKGYADNYRIGVAGGTSLFDSRLHIVASGERYHVDPVQKTDLPIMSRRIILSGAGTQQNPITYLENSDIPIITEAGRAFPAPPTGGGPLVAGREFAADGSLVPFNGVGGGTDGPCCTITASQETNQFYLGSTYEFSDALSAYAAASYNESEYHDRNIPGLRTEVNIFSDNAFLAPSTVAALGGRTQFRFGKLFYGQSGLPTTKEGESRYLNGGFKGEFGNSFNWSLGYTHHRTEQSTSTLDFHQENFYAAIDAVRDGSGNIVCRTDLTNPGLYPGCVPLNMFGAGSVTQSAFDYITDESRGAAINTLDSVQALLSGKLFDLPAGRMGFAVGAEWRKQKLRIDTNADPADAPDFAGLRGVVNGQNLTFQWLNTARASGEYTVKETFAELEAPVFAHTSAGSLTLNGAARLTDYSTSGSVTTWKLGSVYDPLDGLRIRASLSRDIRAPNLFELFAGQTANQARIDDPATGQSVFLVTIAGGNPDLVPEEADTLTLGVVLDPLPGLSLSVDYWSIETTDAIATPYNPQDIARLCFLSGGTSPLCNQIVRQNGVPISIAVTNQNLSSQDVAGIDFEAGYTFDVLGGTLRLHTLGTRLLKFDQINAVGEPTIENAGTADFVGESGTLPLPKWRWSADAGFKTGPLSLSLQGRYIGAYDRSHLLVYTEPKVGSVFYTDISASYDIDRFGGDLQLFVTATNVLDRKAPITPNGTIPGGTVPTFRSTYDILGPQLTLGVRGKF